MSSKLKYLIVLDFEATCSQPTTIPLRDQEIIEFPSLLYSLEKNALVESLEGPHAHPPTFHHYVRPVLHPTLTEFCTGLTGIEQSTVDAAEPFPVVWAKHLEWLKGVGAIDNPDQFAYLTCGDWDMKTALPKDLARIRGVEVPVICSLDRVINVKKHYMEHYGLRKQRGMGTFPSVALLALLVTHQEKLLLAGMLSQRKLTLVGRHHSGIDDCRNIAQIVTAMRNSGWKP